MKKSITLLLTIAVTISAQANMVSPKIQLEKLKELCKNEVLRPITPTYIDNAVEADPWRSNWFFDVQGGVNMFLGTPLGCDDGFGRMKPLLRGHFGKWITPTVGTRLTFDGFNIKAADMQSQGYRAYHMDMLWNPIAYWLRSKEQPRWDVIPYFGVGLVHNNTIGAGCSKESPNTFALSYGLLGRYRLTPRLHITMELGNMTAFQNLDGYGNPREFGDNILGLSAGLSITLGKTGWKRVVDAKPYMARNEQLTALALAERDHNRELTKQHKFDQRSIDELKKILYMEGLLSRYAKQVSGTQTDSLGTDAGKSVYPKNNYSGLNSLMARINGHGGDSFADYVLADNFLGDANEKYGTVNETGSTVVSGDPANEIASTESDNACGAISDQVQVDNIIAVPVYFFFKLGTSKLTDESQLINICEIARIATEYGLHLNVIGAADSATGSVSVNTSLAMDRAQYIADALLIHGMTDDQITLVCEGGISTWPSNEANRHTRIEFIK